MDVYGQRSLATGKHPYHHHTVTFVLQVGVHRPQSGPPSRRPKRSSEFTMSCHPRQELNRCPIYHTCSARKPEIPRRCQGLAEKANSSKTPFPHPPTLFPQTPSSFQDSKSVLCRVSCNLRRQGLGNRRRWECRLYVGKIRSANANANDEWVNKPRLARHPNAVIDENDTSLRTYETTTLRRAVAPQDDGFSFEKRLLEIVDSHMDIHGIYGTTLNLRMPFSKKRGDNVCYAATGSLGT